jgi:hypothetical protein
MSLWQKKSKPKPFHIKPFLLYSMCLCKKQPKPPFMKKLFFLIAAVCLAVPYAVAQHPLVGTWEMISVKGIGADGERFSLDTTAVREIKIITPTHYILIAWDVEGDSLIFNRTMGGQARIDGKKYIEVPMQASVQIFENVSADFSWDLKGDIFTQSGTIVRPDGKKVVLEALVFRRVKVIKPQKNPAEGSWNQISSSFTTRDGVVHSTFGQSDKGMLIVTPTHWMRMDHKNKKFAGALFGTYTLKGNTVVAYTDFSTYPFKKGEPVEFTQKVQGNKVDITGKGMTSDGEEAMFSDTFEKAK